MNRLCRNGSRRLLLSIGRRQRQTCAVFSRSPHANTNDSQTNTHASIHAHSKLAYIAQWFFEPSLIFTPSRSGRKIFGSSASSWLSEPSLVFHSVVTGLIMPPPFCLICFNAPEPPRMTEYCGLCKETWYCSTYCQHLHWPEHKHECWPRVVRRWLSDQGMSGDVADIIIGFSPRGR